MASHAGLVPVFILASFLAATSAFAGAGDATKPSLPMPDDAEDVVFEGESGMLTFSTAKPVKELADFYRALGKKQGWQEEPSVIQQDNMAVLTFMVNGDDVATITVMKMGEKSQVTAEGTALEANGGMGDQATAADEGNAGNSDAPAAAPLVAIDKDGLPIPDGLGNSGSTRTMFSHAVNFSAPNSVAEIVTFYRTELGKQGWKEDAAKVSDSAAELAFTAPDGPAKLIVTRNGDTSDAELTVNDKAGASKSPLAPKPGMVKLVFGNMTDKAADVAIAGKHVKLGAMQGSAGPDGPTLDVPPGKLTAQIKGAKESFTAGPDEIWMVGIGPGGLIAIKQ